VEESEDLGLVRVEMAGARRSSAGSGRVERRAAPVRCAAGLGTEGSPVGGRVLMGSALYTKQTR
jgi:hypothetical protein